jgi:hypothetical protein
MNGKFVLENQSGQVARVLNWQADVAYFVLLHESKRVEALPSLKELDNEGVDYTLIERIEKSAVLKNPVKLINLGRVKFLQEVEKLSPQASEDSDEEKDKKIIPYIFKWTFGAGIGAVALLVALGHFLAPNIENNEPQVVTITPRLEKKLPVVTPHKIIKTPPPTVAQKIKKSEEDL